MNLALDFGGREDFGSIESLSTAAGLQPTAAIESVAAVFREMLQTDGSPVRAVRHQPARPAQFGPLPPGLNPLVAPALRLRGISELYSHQAAAVAHSLAGENVVVVTPTASGK